MHVLHAKPLNALSCAVNSRCERRCATRTFRYSNLGGGGGGGGACGVFNAVSGRDWESAKTCGETSPPGGAHFSHVGNYALGPSTRYADLCTRAIVAPNLCTRAIPTNLCTRAIPTNLCTRDCERDAL